MRISFGFPLLVLWASGCAPCARVGADPPAACLDPACEEDGFGGLVDAGNDRREDATPLTSGQSALGAASAEDWFRFAAGPLEEIAIGVEFIDRFGDIEIELLDAEGDLLAAASGRQDGHRLRWRNPADNAFNAHLRIYRSDPDDPRCQSYRWTSLTCDEEPEEPNDTLVESSSATSGTDLGLTEDSPIDLWKFSLDPGQTADVALTSLPGLGTVALALLDQRGAQLARVETESDEQQLRWTHDGAETTFFYVQPELLETDTCQRYSFTVRVSG